VKFLEKKSGLGKSNCLIFKLKFVPVEVNIVLRPIAYIVEAFSDPAFSPKSYLWNSSICESLAI
jgi:hypothetical protein